MARRKWLAINTRHLVNFRMLGIMKYLIDARMRNFLPRTKLITYPRHNVLILAAAAGASAFVAAVAGAVAGHDGSAGGAGWGVAHVYEGLEGVGGVVDAAVGG
jgi:hypothetical protein